MGLRALLTYTRQLKHYFIAATLVFLVGIWLGYYDYGHFQHLIDAQRDRLQSIVDSLSAGKYKNVLLFVFIFLNNTIVSILMMYLGSFFMILPLYSLITNGMLLGYLAAHNDQGWGYFLKAILPHGIIEIPTVIVASAFGIRLGVLTLQALLSLPFPARRIRSGGRLIAFFKISVPLMLVFVVLLLIAAVIESTFTLWLVSQ